MLARYDYNIILMYYYLLAIKTVDFASRWTITERPSSWKELADLDRNDEWNDIIIYYDLWDVCTNSVRLIYTPTACIQHTRECKDRLINAERDWLTGIIWCISRRGWRCSISISYRPRNELHSFNKNRKLLNRV